MIVIYYQLKFINLLSIEKKMGCKDERENIFITKNYSNLLPNKIYCFTVF